MRLRLQQLTVPLDAPDPVILQRAARRLNCPPGMLSDLKILRRSLDVRPRNPEPTHVLTVDLTFSGREPPRNGNPVRVETATPAAAPAPLPKPTGKPRPIVIGAGPAGLAAAWILAEAGAKPLLIERGQAAANRTAKVAAFWTKGDLDPESHVLFGEGGAGLFSDGKLTARSKDRVRVSRFMELLHACGADASVTIDAAPHIGSDRLLQIVPRIRERILSAGGKIRFETRLDDLVIEKNRLRAVMLNGRETACDHCILATGHSARDVLFMLSDRQVALEARPFAAGIRLELPQAAVNRSQYGKFARDPRLGPASYRLTRREEKSFRACYSFCMCPGGRVLACASEPGHLTTNGMSYEARALPNANAAFLVPVGPEDFPDTPVPALAGIEFQRAMESAAFRLGGGTYALPASRLLDFLEQRLSKGLPEKASGTRCAPAEFRDILPECIVHTLLHALPPMLRQLRPARMEDAVLFAPETRSSSPVRICRTPEGESENIAGLFPAGEGSGYAGGIVSSAVDGMKAAEQVLAQLRS